MGTPVAQLEQTMDFAEFAEWCVFLNNEYKTHSKQEYYLAQIAAMLSNKKAKIKDFLISFGKEKIMKLDAKQQINVFKRFFGIK